MIFTSTFFWLVSIIGTAFDALHIPTIVSLPWGVDLWLTTLVGWINSLPEILPPFEAIITGGKWFLDGIVTLYLLVVLRIMK